MRIPRHARQRPPAAAQPLAFLAAQLHVFTMILSTDETLMRYWLAHYIGLGVRPSHIQVLVDPQRDPARGAGMAALLSPLGVNYTLRGGSTIRTSSATRQAFLRALPADAWPSRPTPTSSSGSRAIWRSWCATRRRGTTASSPRTLRSGSAPTSPAAGRRAGIAEQFPIECAGFRAALPPNFNAQDYKTAFSACDHAGRTRQIAGSHALAPEFYKTPRGARSTRATSRSCRTSPSAAARLQLVHRPRAARGRCT